MVRIWYYLLAAFLPQDYSRTAKKLFEIPPLYVRLGPSDLPNLRQALRDPFFEAAIGGLVESAARQ